MSRPKGSKNKSKTGKVTIPVENPMALIPAPAKHRGRPKGSKNTNNTAKDVSVYTATKETSLAVFDGKTSSPITKEVVDKFDIKPVRKTSELSKFIKAFNEKSYEESIKAAYAWMEDNNKHSDLKVELVNYYPQRFMSKSVLVGYILH